MKMGILCLAVVVSVSSMSAQQPAPSPSLDIAGFLKGQHQNIKRNLIGSAERMPEADFHFKPQGAVAEVRTFGQILAHVVNANYLFCAQAKGEKSPAAPLDDKQEQKPKAELVKALQDAMAYCDGAYDAQTSTTLNEMVKRTLQNNTTIERARGNGLILNVAHNNEHYGNLVTYLRAKGLVPPSSDR
jgi:uncharacterized damage-inducible protein DinB